MNALVTRQSLQSLLNNPDKQFVIRVVGRALIVLFARQTQAEKASNATQLYNGVGFAGCDARSGTLTAKYFLKTGTLLDWQIEKWTAISSRTGYPKICKYVKQLNEAAVARAEVPQVRRPIEQQQLSL